MQYILHEVEKEIYESGKDGIKIGIDERKLRRAIYARVPVKVVWGKKEMNINPKVWMKKGKLIPKIFNYPDNPMQLWYNFVKFPPEKTPEQKAKEEFLMFNV
jgi:hypothetical protein